MTKNFAKQTELYKRIKEFSEPLSSLGYIDIEAPENHDRIAEKFQAAGVSDRESYLDWVAQYKSLINEASQLQRDLRNEAKTEESSLSMTLRRMNRPEISRLNAIRRASKIAARISRQKALEAVAA